MIEEKLNSLGIILPNPPTPAGSYVPIVKTGNILYISGQIPIENGKVAFTGKVSDENLEIAQKAAKMCAVNILSQIKREVGDLDKITKIIKLSHYKHYLCMKNVQTNKLFSYNLDSHLNNLI